MSVRKGRKPKRTTQRRRTAIHEAGHAVIGRALGIPCGAASIVADEDSVGHSICPDPWEILAVWQNDQEKRYREYPHVLHARIITFMAGAAAEIEFFGKCPGADGDDQHQVALMLELFPEADWDKLRVRLRRFTAQLVRRHRAMIDDVAKRLAETGCLSADQMDG